MGGIYELRCLNRLKFHDMHTNFGKYRLRHSKDDVKGEIRRYIDIIVTS
jgi:hypothetical protein